MGGQIQNDMAGMNMGAMNVGTATGVGGVGGAGGNAFEQEVAQLLGVDAGALSGALRSGEGAAAEEIRALSADGEYSAADRQQVEANMIDRVVEQLGIDKNSLTNEQMMALTQLCRECLAGVESEVLGQNGLSAEQSLFAGNDNGAGLGGGNPFAAFGAQNPYELNQPFPFQGGMAVFGSNLNRPTVPNPMVVGDVRAAG